MCGEQYHLPYFYQLGYISKGYCVTGPKVEKSHLSKKFVFALKLYIFKVGVDQL